MKTTLDGIDFTEALDAHRRECLYANGTLDEMRAAQTALLASGYSAQEPTFMYAGCWCVYGYAPQPDVSQAALAQLDAYKFEARHPVWTKSGGAMRKAKTLRKVLKR